MSERKPSFISVRMSPGEFFDRFVIDLRKSTFNTKNYGPRIVKYTKLLDNIKFSGKLVKLVCLLQMYNTDIWNLESDLRKGREGILGRAEVGVRALKIREVNQKRVATVNAINSLFGIEIEEEKFDHASG